MIKRIVTTALAGVMLFSVSACAKEQYKTTEKIQPEQTNAYFFDRFGDEVMPIGGYIGPTPGFGYEGNYMKSQIDNEHFRQVKDCGLNFIIGMKPDYRVQSQEVLDSLKYADMNDVMYFVADSYLYQVTEENAKDPSKYLYVSLDQFKERVKAYKDFPSFAGLVGRDEPWSNMFDQLKQIKFFFEQTFDDNKLLYLNSNSFQCPEGWFGGGPNGTEEEAKVTIRDYMDQWFTKFDGLGYYSYDTYPFVSNEKNHIRPDILENYSLVREFSDKYDVPFWTFMQAGGNWGGSNSTFRKATEGECLWQVNTALAFGAKGYTWFPYNTPPENIGSPEGDDGLVGRGGQKLEHWYHAQKANRQTQACDHILMKSVYKGMIRVLSGKDDTTNKLGLPEIETKQLNGQYRQLKGASGDNALIGCFNYQGKTAFYVVNNSVTLDKAKVNLSFDGTYKAEIIQAAESYNVAGNNIELTFAPGEGACIVLE